MSRVGKVPVKVPAGVEITVDGQSVSAKGPKGTMSREVNPLVAVVHEDGEVKVTPRDASRQADALAATWRMHIGNMVTGVKDGFQRKLEIVGVGYRANVQGKTLNLTLGFSHPIAMAIPEGISIETPSQTEVLVKGSDKQQVGQIAANIRAYRPPEPYKGKGVKYAGEVIKRKEAKKA